MVRFDLYNNPSSRSKAKSPYLLEVQSDPLGNLMSRVVIPLTHVVGNYTPDKVAQDLAPIVEIARETLIYSARQSSLTGPRTL